MYKITSRFIETPCQQLMRYAFDMTAGCVVEFPFGCPSGATVRVDITTWQDEVAAINKAAIIGTLTDLGALSVDIRVTPVPRVTVRAASVLAAERLRDKIKERAELVEDVLDPAIYTMADNLEDMPVDKLLEMVAGGQG